MHIYKSSKKAFVFLTRSTFLIKTKLSKGWDGHRYKIIRKYGQTSADIQLLLKFAKRVVQTPLASAI